MSKFKKAVALALSAVMCLSLAACGQKEDDVTMNIAGLKGPTTMGMVKLIDDAANGKTENDYNFTLAGTADEITPKLVKGELDIAAVPCNLASVLYNKTEGGVQILAVNTLGVLYLVEKGDSVNSIEDLRGKTIYMTGKGAVPEYTVRYILAQNGLDADKDVAIEWKNEANEIVALMQSTNEDIVAVLPQPFATVAQNQVEGLHTVMDLNEAWNALDNGSQIVTGVIVARTEFVEKYPKHVESFLKEYASSIDYVVNNPADAAALIENVGIVKAAVAEKALPYCNITYLDGDEMKAAVSGYLKVLYEQNPKAVGGELPGDNFYYTEK